MSLRLAPPPFAPSGHARSKLAPQPAAQHALAEPTPVASTFAQQASERARHELAAFAAHPEKLHEAMTRLFGPHYDRDLAEQFRRQLLNGDDSWIAAMLLDPAPARPAVPAVNALRRAAGGVRNVARTVVKKAKKKGRGLFGRLKKLGGKLLGGVKKLGGKLLKGLGPLGRALQSVGGALNKLAGKFFKTFDFLSPALLLVPGVGPGLYAAYNTMKTAYHAVNGDLKQAFTAGIGALTGVGGMAGKVADLAQHGMQVYDAAQGALRGDVRSMLGLAGAAAGFTDPTTAARVREVASLAGRGHDAIDALFRGDAVAALTAMGRAVDVAAPQLGAGHAQTLHAVFSQAMSGARHFASVAGLAQATEGAAPLARAARAGFDLARLTAGGDAPGMLRQLELLSAFGGAPLGTILGGSIAPLRAAMAAASPLALRVADALHRAAPDAAFDSLKHGVAALGSARAARRATLGLALARLGAGMHDGLLRGDAKLTGRALDFALRLAGVTGADRSAARDLDALRAIDLGDGLATRAAHALLPGLGASGDAAGPVLREILPWMDRGAALAHDADAGRVDAAVRALFALVEWNGVALPRA